MHRRMNEWLDQRPSFVAITFLFAVAMLRGQATYGLARWAAGQAAARAGEREGRRRRFARWLGGDEVARGRAAVERWGLPIIAVCYLTVGFQTLVLAGAGALRIGWARFTVAQVPGALAWAGIYATIGLAAWRAVGGIYGSGLLVASALVGLVVLATTSARRADE
ncbi:MAG: DedA family protein [Nocardioides sp.]